MSVDVAGGELSIEMSGPDPSTAGAVVVMVHGITANLVTWRLVAARLPATVCAVAVDLRGRGGSSELPGPWGMARHAEDLVAVLDRLSVDEAIVVGHSMGAYVTTNLARLHPSRLAAAVLVDGGLPLSRPEVGEPQAMLDALLGPATARLSMSFASREDYRAYWRDHPALSEVWSPFIEDYVDYDLGGRPPHMRPRPDEEAVRADGAELLLDDEVRGAIDHVACPAELVRVERGIMNEPRPLIPLGAAEAVAARKPNLAITTVPSLNHYTVVLTPAGADAVAQAINRFLQ